MKVEDCEKLLEDVDFYEYLEEFVKIFVAEFEYEVEEANKEVRLDHKPTVGKFTKHVAIYFVLYSVLFLVGVETVPLEFAGLSTLINLCHEYVKYFASRAHREKSKRVIKLIQFIEKGELRAVVVEAACELFWSYEAQLIRIVNGYDRGLEKVVGDAMHRMFGYISDNYKEVKKREVNANLMIEGVIKGKSRWMYGYKLNGRNNFWHWITTSGVWGRTGLYDDSKEVYYETTRSKAVKYGYRRKFEEEEIESDAFESYPEPQLYTYILTEAKIRTYNASLLEKINREYIIQRAERLENKIDELEKKILETRKERVFNVPYPGTLFTGRREQLETLFSFWKEYSLDNERQCAALCVSGVAGIGKTELVKKFAHDNLYYENVLWIAAESLDSLKTSFTNVASYLDVPCESKDLPHVIEGVYKKVANVKTICIFDGAPNYSLLHHYMPWTVSPGRGEYFVILTSRSKNWRIRDVASMEVIALDEFTTQEAFNYVRKALDLSEKDSSQDEDIEKLVQKFDCYPFALAHFTKYIETRQEMVELQGRKYTVSEFLEEYERAEAAQKLQILKFQSEEHFFCSCESFLSLWEKEFENLKRVEALGSKALEFLEMLAESPTDELNLSNIQNRFGNQDEFWKCMNVLERRSLITIEDGNVKVFSPIKEIILLTSKGAA